MSRIVSTSNKKRLRFRIHILANSTKRPFSFFLITAKSTFTTRNNHKHRNNLTIKSDYIKLINILKSNAKTLTRILIFRKEITISSSSIFINLNNTIRSMVTLINRKIISQRMRLNNNRVHTKYIHNLYIY